MRNRYGLFVADAPFRPDIGAASHSATALGQDFFAVCADSRVAPEPVFSRNIDELSTVRNAGNVANAAALGSTGHSAAVLAARLPVTMEHASRGATAAAVDVAKKNAAFPGSTGDGGRPTAPPARTARAGGATC